MAESISAAISEWRPWGDSNARPTAYKLYDCLRCGTERDTLSENGRVIVSSVELPQLWPTADNPISDVPGRYQVPLS
jgi:hypothetical protein